MEKNTHLHTHTEIYHSHLPRGLHAACSVLPCDVYPTSDILLAELAHHSTFRIPTRISKEKSPKQMGADPNSDMTAI